VIYQLRYCCNTCDDVLLKTMSDLSGRHAEECREEDFENRKSGRGHHEDRLQAGMSAVNKTELQWSDSCVAIVHYAY